MGEIVMFPADRMVDWKAPEEIKNKTAEQKKAPENKEKGPGDPEFDAAVAQVRDIVAQGDPNAPDKKAFADAGKKVEENYSFFGGGIKSWFKTENRKWNVVEGMASGATASVGMSLIARKIAAGFFATNPNYVAVAAAGGAVGGAGYELWKNRKVLSVEKTRKDLEQTKKFHEQDLLKRYAAAKKALSENRFKGASKEELRDFEMFLDKSWEKLKNVDRLKKVLEVRDRGDKNSLSYEDEQLLHKITKGIGKVKFGRDGKYIAKRVFAGAFYGAIGGALSGFIGKGAFKITEGIYHTTAPNAPWIAAEQTNTILRYVSGSVMAVDTLGGLKHGMTKPERKYVPEKQEPKLVKQEQKGAAPQIKIVQPQNHAAAGPVPAEAPRIMTQDRNQKLRNEVAAFGRDYRINKEQYIKVLDSEKGPLAEMEREGLLHPVDVAKIHLAIKEQLMQAKKGQGGEIGGFEFVYRMLKQKFGEDVPDKAIKFLKELRKISEVETKISDGIMDSENSSWIKKITA